MEVFCALHLQSLCQLKLLQDVEVFCVLHRLSPCQLKLLQGMEAWRLSSMYYTVCVSVKANYLLMWWLLSVHYSG